MGLEANCTLERDRRKTVGRAMLESDHIAFRGGTKRARFVLAELTRVEVSGDALVLANGEGEARLHLAEGMAAKWLAKIRNPRSLLDKMGVQEGMRVAVLDVTDAEFLRLLERRVGRYETSPVPGCDLIVLEVDTVSALARLGELRRCLTPAGGVWVVHRKGAGATVRDGDVFVAGRQAGLVDNKVVSFSATHTAERLVIPRADR